MSKKLLFGTIAIIFLVIIFLVPLAKNDSKSSEVVKTIKEKTQTIVGKKEEVKLEAKKEKDKTFEERFVEPFKKPDKLEEYQAQQQLKETNKDIEETLSKLDAILKEKNIKLKDVEINQEERKKYLDKLDKLQNDIKNINDK